MKVALASGKGGTGKTVLSTSLAWLLAREGHAVTYADADVEEPNGHLFLRPELTVARRFGTPVPSLPGGRCTGCGECQRFCAYNAIVALSDRVLLFPELCHGCGGCLLACPERALTEARRKIGTLEAGLVKGLPRPIRFLSGTLDVGEARATPLVAGLLDRLEGNGVVLVDAPPGASCSVMEVVRRVDRVVLVTEPTPFGLHDLRLAVEMVRAIDRPVVAVINRADLGNEGTRRYLDSAHIEVLAEVPYLTDVAAAYARGDVAARVSPRLQELLAPIGRRLVREVSA